MINKIVTSLVVVLLLMSCRPENPENGVSLKLAKERKDNITEVKYVLDFNVPKKLSDSIHASVRISFQQKKREQLVVDFKQSEKHVKSVLINGEKSKYEIVNHHIIIPKSEIHKEKNVLEIQFIAGEEALNRSEEFMYTLFVPDRASTCFPCFDQPDIKAIYELCLTIPEGWVAVANAKHNSKTNNEGVVKYSFLPTKKLSTYLFSFVVGEFQVETKMCNNRELTMYHRETDTVLLKRNLTDIFDIHSQSLDWLEDYTSQKYPFGKFDFVMIPDFQYGGMEHPGAILYRASKCFLSENASVNQKLARANLIAHETSHIWFGDLITMEWFNDVWLKEVFANFLADKIVNPYFKDINHKLKFLFAHTPSSMSVDRTKGTHPIIQKLDNMKNAGSLYGSIIYHKSPIAMNQLELLMGEEEFKKAVQEYVSKYAFGNANWDQLIDVFNLYSDVDLKKWSDVWIKTPNAPKLTYTKTKTQEGWKVTITQTAPSGNETLWNQKLELSINGEVIRMTLDKKTITVNLKSDEKYCDLIINSNGQAYCSVDLHKDDINYYFKNIGNYNSDIHRAVLWIQLWENVLNAKVNPEELLDIIKKSIQVEKNPLIMGYLLSCYSTTINMFVDKEYLRLNGAVNDKFLQSMILSEKSGAIANMLFRTLKGTVSSVDIVNYITQYFYKKRDFGKVKLSENSRISLAYELMILQPEERDKILNYLNSTITNPDKLNKINFVSEAVTTDKIKLDNFFRKLKFAKSREQEPWVLSSLSYIHHPINREYSTKYLTESLELLEEIQQTGDIFFPKNWLSVTFSSHYSKEAIYAVEEFLKMHKNYPEKLRLKILQSTDMCYRANSIQYKY